MIVSRSLLVLLSASQVLLSGCVGATEVRDPVVTEPPIVTSTIQPGFAFADSSPSLHFPADLGAHPDFRTEWWYYTGNLETPEGRHFGFELTIFRVGIVPPTVESQAGSAWSTRDVYFSHFALSDTASNDFYAFERYSRPSLGLAGAQSDPYRVWLEDWSITERTPGVYQLQAQQGDIKLDLLLTDEIGIVLHGENGYSRKGENPANASYYYSQPRLSTKGVIQIQRDQFDVSGLTWSDHEFSTSVLDQDQIGWDWFSLQLEDGYALMLFQLRERSGGISESASGTFIFADGASQALHHSDYEIVVLDTWRSPHTGGLYPAAWRVRINRPSCVLEIHPWMNDQEINFTSATYWEGAVYFEGTCNDMPVRGNGYVELTGYAGNVPLQQAYRITRVTTPKDFLPNRSATYTLFRLTKIA